MDYELAKELKDNGFMQAGSGFYMTSDDEASPFVQGIKPGEIVHLKDGVVYLPTLSELIEACGEVFEALHYVATKGNKQWQADALLEFVYGKTPEEAVAKLWLALNKK